MPKLGFKFNEEQKKRLSDAHKGQVAWNTGKKLTAEHRAKLSAARMGKEPWNKGQHQPKKVRDHTERTHFRRTCQSLVFKRDNYTCQICDQYGGSIQVDHIKSWAKYPELRFDLDNCRTLCMACHYYITFKKKIPQGIVWGHNFSKRIAS